MAPLTGRLGRRLVIGFLAVILPGTVILAAVTLSSISRVREMSRQLAEISRSLEATSELHAILSEAARPPQDYLLRGGVPRREEFDRLIRTAEERLASCASTACHGASRSPREMATILRPFLEQLRNEGRRIFAAVGPEAVSGGLGRMDEIDGAVAGMTEQLHRMSAALLARVERLRQQSEAVVRHSAVMVGLLAGALVGLASAMAVILARRITRPLRELLLGTRRVIAGDWASRVPVEDSSEIGELAGSFNTMLDELHHHREQVDQQRHILEERVQQRTEELKRKDEELLRSEKLASLGLLASGVAHELNNPLTSILMNVNLAMEDVPEGSPPSRELRKIDQDALRCKRIIDDLRMFSRRRELKKASCRVEGAVEQALQMVEHALDAGKIQVGREIAPDLPEVVWDPERMTQVLTNLLVNAVQAMPHGGRLRVTVWKEGDWLSVEVSDTGSGIPPEHRSRIFDPFFTTKSDGTGLGLSISYGIVHEHGGRIDVTSRTREEAGPEGETGTRVRLVVPLSGPRA